MWFPFKNRRTLAQAMDQYDKTLHPKNKRPPTPVRSIESTILAKSEEIKGWAKEVNVPSAQPDVTLDRKEKVDIQELRQDMSEGWKKLNPLAFDYEIQEFFRFVDAEVDLMVRSGKDKWEVRYDLPRSKLTDGQLEFVVTLRHRGENQIGLKIRERNPVRSELPHYRDITTNATRTVWQLRDAFILRARGLDWVCKSFLQEEYQMEVIKSKVSIGYIPFYTEGEIEYTIKPPEPKKYMLY